jgi:hypothetical protein
LNADPLIADVAMFSPNSAPTGPMAMIISPTVLKC